MYSIYTWKFLNCKFENFLFETFQPIILHYDKSLLNFSGQRTKLMPFGSARVHTDFFRLKIYCNTLHSIKILMMLSLDMIQE